MKQFEVKECFVAGVISDLNFTYNPWTLIQRTMVCKTEHFSLSSLLSAPDLTSYALAHINFAFVCFSWIVMILFAFKINW